MRHASSLLVLGAVAAIVAARPRVTPAAPLQSADTASFHPVSALHWVPGPGSLPKGAQMVVLEGDPTKPGMFTMRIRFPAGFKVAAHYHSQTEHATVLAGTLHIGMGDRFDSAATRALPAGSFGFWPAGMRHYAWVEGETILQLHGQGPWTITYVNPGDDPRAVHP